MLNPNGFALLGGDVRLMVRVANYRHDCSDLPSFAISARFGPLGPFQPLTCSQSLGTNDWSYLRCDFDTTGGDGIINPGETIDLTLNMINASPDRAATQVTADLSFDEGWLSPLTAQVEMPDAAPLGGSSALFTFEVIRLPFQNFEKRLAEKKLGRKL